MLKAVRPQLDGWEIGPVITATHAQVALSDEIGEILGATFVVVLIGERPGLSSPDGFGNYLTYQRKTGLNDADRNCISNVRPEGLGFDIAVFQLHHLLNEALRLKLTGAALKDDIDYPVDRDLGSSPATIGI